MTTPPDYTAMIRALEDTGKYRVMRKLEACSRVDVNYSSEVRRGLVVDVETTGLDSSRDEIIELAMIPFTYGLDGRLTCVGEPFHRYRQPSQPIPAVITELTGITDEMVAGHVIDPAEVAAVVADADLIIAHNAGFDRRFLERLSDAFVTKPWACSMAQVDWAAEGFEGTKLGYLAMGAGFFYDRHRATNDCLAALELLTLPSPKTGQPAMAQLLKNARRPTWRIWAENSPFEFKDLLKARGYRWNGDVNGNPRAWYTDVEDDELAAELTFLKTEIYQRDVEPFVKKITAFERFSIRN